MKHRAASCLPTRVAFAGAAGLRRLLFAFSAILSAAPLAAESWLSMDVGKAVSGAAVISANTTFTLTGGGDIGGTSDSFRFVFLRARGDCDIVARLVAQTATPPATLHSEARAGVMIRQSLSSATLCAAVLRTPGRRIHFQWRLTPLGITASEITLPEDPVALSFAVAGTLQTNLEFKQYLLELQDTMERLRLLRIILAYDPTETEIKHFDPAEWSEYLSKN